jgi:hypothetical protein
MRQLSCQRGEAGSAQVRSHHDDRIVVAAN